MLSFFRNKIPKHSIRESNPRSLVLIALGLSVLGHWQIFHRLWRVQSLPSAIPIEVSSSVEVAQENSSLGATKRFASPRRHGEGQRHQPSQDRSLPSAAEAGEWEQYLGRLRSYLARQLDYPSGSRLRGEAGIVIVGIALERTGKVLRLDLAVASDFPELDAAVLGALARIQQENVEPFPESVATNQVDLEIPIVFSLRNPG